MIYKILTLLSLCCYYTFANITTLIAKDVEDHKQELIAEITKLNFENKKGWHGTLLIGHFPDELYKRLENVGSFVTTNIDKDDHYIEDMFPYYPNTIVLDCKDLGEFENAFLKAKNGPYWHPHSNIIVYFRSDNELVIAKIFFILWFYKACNSIMIRHDDTEKAFLLTHYSGYISVNYPMEKQFGCWKVRNIGLMVTSYEESFYCEKGCLNATSDAKLRFNNGALCIGYSARKVKTDELKKLRHFNLFEDKGRNLHGYTLRAFVTEVLPFFKLTETGNQSYSLSRRDGYMWNTIAASMNFTLDFSVNKGQAKSEFHYENTIQQIFDFANGKAELFLLPIYTMDLVIVDVDMSQQYKESGVCFMAHRADFVTVLFDVKLVMENYTLFLEYVFCFIMLWLGLFLFSIAERGQFSLDQAGKDLLNTIRNSLSITLHKPPKKRAARFLLTVSIWGFFVVNFATQAAIISFFTAFKRGKEVETFDDIIEKGYEIFGMASPDVVLPDEDERFRKINSKFVAIKNMMACVNRLKNETEIFCLVECSMGRYSERNELNSKGEQYLHMAQDRIHNRYLDMILQKHSPLTNQFNKILLALVEGGIIQKWEEFRFNDIKEEVSLKPLGVKDLIGIFQAVGFFVGLSIGVFVIEVFIGMYVWARRNINERYKKWKRFRRIKKVLERAKKLGKIKCASVGTQTMP